VRQKRGRLHFSRIDPTFDDRNRTPGNWSAINFGFGKTFYDSEGVTGVGRLRVLRCGESILPDSHASRKSWIGPLSAILVETLALYGLALPRPLGVRRFRFQGVLRYDRKSGKIQKIRDHRTSSGQFLRVGQIAYCWPRIRAVQA